MLIDHSLLTVDRVEFLKTKSEICSTAKEFIQNFSGKMSEVTST